MHVRKRRKLIQFVGRSSRGRVKVDHFLEAQQVVIQPLSTAT